MDPSPHPSLDYERHRPERPRDRRRRLRQTREHAGCLAILLLCLLTPCWMCGFAAAATSRWDVDERLVLLGYVAPLVVAVGVAIFLRVNRSW